MPSNAVPILRCVAPVGIAASRSPLIPAEMIVGGRADARGAAESGAAGRTRGRSTPSGATAISPPRASPARPRWPLRPAGPPDGDAATLAGSPSRLDLDRQSRAAPAESRPVWRRPRRRARGPGGRGRRSARRGVPDDAVCLVGLQLPDEVPGDWAAPWPSARATAAALGAASWSRFSPRSVSPRLRQRDHVRGGLGLGDRDERELVRSRPAAAHAGAEPDRQLRGEAAPRARPRARAPGRGPGLRAAHLRKSGTSRSSSSSKTTGRRRPAVTSKTVSCLAARPESFQLDGPGGGADAASPSRRGTTSRSRRAWRRTPRRLVGRDERDRGGHVPAEEPSPPGWAGAAGGLGRPRPRSRGAAGRAPGAGSGGRAGRGRAPTALVPPQAAARTPSP